MKKYILLLLTLIFVFTSIITVYAEDTQLVDNIDESGFDWGTNGKSVCKEKAYYLTFLNTTNNKYYIFSSDDKMRCYKGMSLDSSEGEVNLYRLDNNTYKLVSTYGSYVQCTTGSLSNFQCYYGNYDIIYRDSEYNERTFFYQTPLTDSKTLTILKGGITAMMITEKTLTGIKTILVYLIVLVVSALALRKGWAMLKTILLGV